MTDTRLAHHVELRVAWALGEYDRSLARQLSTLGRDRMDTATVGYRIVDALDRDHAAHGATLHRAFVARQFDMIVGAMRQLAGDGRGCTGAMLAEVIVVLAGRLMMAGLYDHQGQVVPLTDAEMRAISRRYGPR